MDIVGGKRHQSLIKGQLQGEQRLGETLSPLPSEHRDGSEYLARGGIGGKAAALAAGMEEDALLRGKPGGEGGRGGGGGALQQNCRERWLAIWERGLAIWERGLLLGLIALLEEIGGATTAAEFVSYGVVGTEILAAVETGYLVKRAHEIRGQRQ